MNLLQRKEFYQFWNFFIFLEIEFQFKNLL